jgi:diaminopropionate ammonia-lyase
MDSLTIIEASRVSTPLRSAPVLADHCKLGRVWIKDETVRPLGNFKVLGGASAGLKALARWANCTVEELFAQRGLAKLPALVCASDGNHGLAVAIGASAAGAPATILLHELVPETRRLRIAATGATIVVVPGTYDDAVERAVELASAGDAILIPDTSDDPGDPTVRDVMQGYEQICRETVAALTELEAPMPSHLFIQAGVGGLAAAMCVGIGGKLAAPGRVLVVEPSTAACVNHALSTGKIERISGSLETNAEMLSCGLASASAVSVLRNYGAACVAVTDEQMDDAVASLSQATGIRSTPSGAAGLAGLVRACTDPALRELFELSHESDVLLVASEAEIA